MSDNQPSSPQETDLLSLSKSFNDRAAQAEQKAYQLEQQSRQARQEAADLRRNAQLLQDAHRLVERERAAQKLGALLASDGKGARVIFLIDGSGSMQGSFIEAAINAAAKIAVNTQANGGSVLTMLFGDQEPRPIDITDESQRAIAIRGLNCGTELLPSIEAVTKTLNKSQPTHVIVLSDGDLFDIEASKNAVKTMLQDFPNASFDAVQLCSQGSSTRNSYLKMLLDELAKSETVRVPKFHYSAAEPDMVAAVVGQLLADRMAQQPAAKKSPSGKKKTPTP